MNIKEQGQDRVLFIAVIALISFGLFMLFSASWVKSLEITGGDSRTYFLVSQMIKLIPAFFIFHRFFRFISFDWISIKSGFDWP